jgi:hypothetical protein
MPDAFLSRAITSLMNRNLLELAMRTCHPKVLKVKPPRIFGYLLEAFSFSG